MAQKSALRRSRHSPVPSSQIQIFPLSTLFSDTIRLYLPLKSDVKFYKITKDKEGYIFVYLDGGWKTRFLLMPVTYVVEEAPFKRSVTQNNFTVLCST